MPGDCQSAMIMDNARINFAKLIQVFFLPYRPQLIRLLYWIFVR